MKFIHTADLHLGYKFSSEYSEKTLKILCENQRKVFSNIINLGTEKQIDALFIAGDLFDLPKVSDELISFVKKEFERAPFSIFIICGNHDPLSTDSVYKKEIFSPNVYIYPEKITSVSFKDADIYGYSFTGPHKLDNSLENFQVENKEKINILLSHGDILKESYYNPMTLSDIEKSQADYVALGHIHLECDIKKTGETYYGYSGTPQGSTFKETGATYVILGEIQKGFLNFEKVNVSEHEFLNLTLNIDIPETNDEIISLIKKEVSSYNLSKSLFNITVKGYIKDGFLLDENYITGELQKDLLYIKLKFDLTRKYNIELIKKEDSVRGEFVRNAQKLLDGYDDDYILKVIEYGVERL